MYDIVIFCTTLDMEICNLLYDIETKTNFVYLEPVTSWSTIVCLTRLLRLSLRISLFCVFFVSEGNLI